MTSSTAARWPRAARSLWSFDHDAFMRGQRSDQQGDEECVQQNRQQSPATSILPLDWESDRRQRPMTRRITWQGAVWIEESIHRRLLPCDSRA
jgi:hypothetical protein